MKIIKVGMIGAGQISYDHCRSVAKHDQAEVIAVSDPSEKRCKKLKKEFGLRKIYAKNEDLLADPDIDAVTIAVPNAFHAPLAKAALEAGKHVLLDKPFALNQKEALAVLKAARKARKIFTLGMNWRFNPKTQTVRSLVERGELGEIYHAKTCILRRSGIPKFGTWFSQKKLAGGGGMLDIGVHFLDCCLYIMDNFKPVAVSGATYTKFGNRGLGEGSWGMSDPGKHRFDVDDFATALIKMKDGATVQLDASWALHMEQGGRQYIEFFGTEAGAAVLPDPKLFKWGRKKGEYNVTEVQGVKPIYAHANRQHNWINAILGKEKLCCTMDQALAVQKILDAVYESSKTGREVRIK